MVTNRSLNAENGIFGIDGTLSPTTNQDVKLPKLPMTTGPASGRIINTEIETIKKSNLMKSYESRKMSRENNDGSFSSKFEARNKTVQSYENFGSTDNIRANKQRV
jgi:hypothetical protein